jgi:outer membrane protein assembly factor BamB
VPAAATADPPAAWQADPGHTGFAQSATFKPPLGKRWIRRDLGEDVSYPVMAEGKVFLTANGSIYALDQKTGATAWSRSIAADGLAYDAGRVFAVDKSGVLQAMSAATGELAWTTPLTESSAGVSPPTASGDYVYVASIEATYGVRQADGIVVWTSEDAESRVPVAVDSDRAYVGAGCSVHALQRTLGIEEWNHGGGCTDSTFAGTVAAGQIYSGAADQGVVLDPLTGTQADSYAAGSPPAIANGIGYFVGAHELFARAEESGLVQWRHAVDQSLILPPLVAGGNVYTLDSQGLLVAIAADSGLTTWKRQVQIQRTYTDEKSRWPGMAAAGDTLVISADGRVTAFAPGPDTPGVDDPDKPSGAGARLTLKVTRKLTAFGHPVRLTGTLENENGGFSGAIDIQADPWPYGSFEHLRTVHSRYGTFQATVRPDRNTIYRAVHTNTFPALRSPAVRVLSDFFEHFTVRALGRRSVRIRINVAGPRDLRLAGRRIHVYHFHRRAPFSTRIGTLPLRRHGHGARASGVLRTPLLRRHDLFFTCIREPRDNGFGRWDKSLRRCGRRRL